MGGETTVIPSTYPPAYPLDGKWTPYPYYPQACAEAYPSASPTGPTWRMDGGGTTYPESLPSQSILSGPGPEGVPPKFPPLVSIDDPAFTKLAIADTACSSRKNGSSTLTKIPRKKPVVVSSRQPGRLAGARKRREALERPYSCDRCGKRYSQPQNVLRHQREEHNKPHSCIVSGCEFEWTRPDEFRAHLDDCHHDVDADKVLGKPAGARRRSKIMGRDLPPPSIESVRRTQAEPRQRSMTPALPAVANVTRVPLSTMSSVVNDPQPEPAITTRKHEYTRSLGSLPDTNVPSVFSSTEKCAQSVSYLDISTRCDQNWSSAADPGGSTAAKRPAFVNFEVQQAPLPSKDRRRIDFDPSVPWVEPVGDIAVRDESYAPGDPPVTPDLTHVPSELDILHFSSATHGYLLSPLLSPPSLFS